MTDHDARSLEVVWPELWKRLMRQLRGIGVDVPTAEDLIQEVAARILDRPLRFSSVDELMAWSATVARHLAIDHWRRQARRQTVPLEDAPSPLDLEDLFEHRRRLTAVMRSWSDLSDLDRHALSTPFTGARAASRAEAVRWAVRRHTARARLAAMVDGPSRISA